MKHLQTFESFLNKSTITESSETVEILGNGLFLRKYSNDGNRFNDTPEWELSYRDEGFKAKSPQMPYIDLLEELRKLYGISKGNFPTGKKEFHKFSKHRGSQGRIMLPNGAELEWYPSTYPTVYVKVFSNDKSAIDKVKQDIERIILR